MPRLSERESEILGLAAQGMLDKEIALDLGISTNTLRTYWSRIRAKLGQSSRASLVASWLQQPGSRPSMNPRAVPSMETWWETDHVRGISRASDHLNALFGLTPGVPHRTEEFEDHFDALALQRKEAILRTAEQEGQTSVVYHGKGQTIEGPAHFYTVASLSFAQGKLVRSCGHTQVIEAETALTQLTVGMWAFERFTGRFVPDEGCRTIFGIVTSDLPPVEEFARRVVPAHRASFEEAIRGLGPQTDIVVQLVAETGLKSWARVVTNPCLSVGNTSVGTMLGPA